MLLKPPRRLAYALAKGCVEFMENPHSSSYCMIDTVLWSKIEEIMTLVQGARKTPNRAGADGFGDVHLLLF